MIPLINIKWGEFNIIDLFDIVDGYYNKKPFIKGGKIPFLGATQYNNGITNFYSKETIKTYNKVGEVTSKDYKKRVFKGNCIAVTNNGSVGNAYYQETEFTCSHDVTPLYLKSYKLNKKLALFLIQCLSKAGESFEYAKKWRPKRMRKSKILLPLDNKNNPNWKFMEDYILYEEKKQLKMILKFFKQKVLDNLIITASSHEVKWKEFHFTDVFTQRKNNNENTFYVDSCFMGSDIGNIFYQVYDFVENDYIKILKKECSDKYLYLFMLSFIKKMNEKYNFNESINEKQLEKEKLILPIDINENINFKYMKNIMKDYIKDSFETIIKLSTNREKKKDDVLCKKWKSFVLEEIAIINSGIDIYAKERINGKTPYITSTALKNGIGYFVNNNNKTYFSNRISVNRNGSVGYAFYHKYQALYSNDTRNIALKETTSYTKLFVTNQITRQKEKYGYGYKMGTGRLKRQMIMLPETQSGNPDYEYMDNFMRNLENEKLIKYLKNKK